MQYRPSAQVLLYLRIDELADVDAYDAIVAAGSTDPDLATLAMDPGAASLDPETTLALLDTQLETLEQTRDALPPDSYDVALRNLQAERDMVLQSVVSRGVDDARPWALLGVTPDLRYARVGLLPRHVEIERNGFRTADTARVVLDWKDVPFDPRILRAAGIEIVVGVVTDDEYQRGLAGERDPVSGQLVSVVRQNPGAPTPDTTTRFVGWVDDWDIDFEDDAGQVTIEARDFTALFLDCPLDGAHGLPLDLPLDRGIASMLSNYPTVAGIVVKYQSTRNGVAVPAPIPARSVPVQNRARSGQRATRARTSDQRTNLWDVITDITVQMGLIPVMRGYELHLIDPRVIYGTQSGIRRMIYGRNLKKLSFARKLGGTKVPTIEVRAYDPSIGRTRWARCPVRPGQPNSGVLGVTNPPRALRANEVTPGGRRLDERIQTIILKNTTNPTTLARAAAALFEQIGRQEIEGQFSTADVCSWDLATGDSLPAEQADLLRIEAGDSVELLVKPRDPAQPDQAAITAGDWIGAERSQRVAFLVNQGMPRRVAQQFAALQDQVANTIFRIQNANIVYDVDDGIEITADFVNFLEVRETEVAQAPSAEDDALSFGPAETAMQVAGDRQDPTAEALRAASAFRRALTRLDARAAATAAQPSPVVEGSTEIEFTLAEADEIALRENARDQP